jgi:hypothetical protein
MSSYSKEQRHLIFLQTVYYINQFHVIPWLCFTNFIFSEKFSEILKLFIALAGVNNAGELCFIVYNDTGEATTASNNSVPRRRWWHYRRFVVSREAFLNGIVTGEDSLNGVFVTDESL